jgi:hypothetical protein
MTETIVMFTNTEALDQLVTACEAELTPPTVVSFSPAWLHGAVTKAREAIFMRQPRIKRLQAIHEQALDSYTGLNIPCVLERKPGVQRRGNALILIDQDADLALSILD